MASKSWWEYTPGYQLYDKAVKPVAEWTGDYLSDPTGVKREREGYKAMIEDQNRQLAEARGRVTDLTQMYGDTAMDIGRGYDFLAQDAPGQYGRLGDLTTGQVPVYGGAGFTGTVSDYLDPSIEFQKKQARDMIQSGAAAQGNLLSGKAQKELADRAQQIGQKGYADAFDRMFRDRGYMTDEERQKYLSQLGANKTMYDRQKDLTSMALGGLGTQRDIAKWGTEGMVSGRLPTYGTTEGTAAGYGDMLRGRQYADLTKGIVDFGKDLASSYIKQI